MARDDFYVQLISSHQMIRASLFLIFFVPWTLVCSSSAIVWMLFDSSGRSYHVHARIWSWLALKVAGVRITVTGADRVPRDSPVILMGNHQGNFDIFALFQAVPIRFLWLAKEELFRVPVFGWSMRRAGYIPLNRGHGTKALKSLEFASAAICQGTNLIIFPEGTRSNDGSLLPFKKGGFLLAINARVPVVPFTINGSHQINPRNQLKLCPGEISIDFGEPIETAGLNPVQYPTLAETARNAIGHNLKP